MIASSILIEEKTGQKRRIALIGAGLPLQGTSWKTDQKLVTKWYAGNPWEATQHVMGPMDPPSEFKGVWNTTRLIASPATYAGGSGASFQQVVIASELRELFDGDQGIIRSGALLRVTWASNDGRSIAREGRIAESDFSHVRFDDIAWTMNFVWTGRGNGPPREVQFNGDDALVAQRTAIAALNDMASTIPGTNGPETAVPGLPQSATDPSLGSLESVSPLALGEINAAGDQASFFAARVSASFAASVDITSATAFDVSADAAISAHAAATFSGGVVRRLGEIPSELFALPGTSAGIVAAIAAWVAAIEFSAQKSEAAAQDLALAAAKRKNALAAQTKDKLPVGAVRATYLAKRGDTFASIAFRWFGSADLGGQLARSNGVPSYQVAPNPGQVVVIPVFGPSDLTAP